MVQKRRTRSEDEWVEEADDAPWVPGLVVPAARPLLTEPTGLLAPNGKPIIRVYRASNPIGFLAELDEDADGECYDYAEGTPVDDECYDYAEGTPVDDEDR
jgi:hypothetical protein